MIAISTVRCPLIAMNSSTAMLPKKRDTALTCAFAIGSKKDAKLSPICSPTISPASSTAVKTSRTVNPIAMPMPTCWISVPSAAASFRPTVG